MRVSTSRSHGVLRSLMLVLCVSLLAGCAAHGPGSIQDTYARHKGLARLAVSIGVQKAVAGDAQRRMIIIEVAHRAKVLLDTSSIDVMQVLPFALAEIAEQRQLSKDVRFLLEELATAVLTEVQGLVEAFRVPKTEVTVLIAEALGWIERAARQAA